MLAVAPYSLYAQDAAGDDSQAEQRKPASARKVYETRVVSGGVVDAATNRPLAGALVSATGIDGYSVLTGDDGSYELKVPVFTTSVFVSTPDYNGVEIGLGRDTEQRTAAL